MKTVTDDIKLRAKLDELLTRLQPMAGAAASSALAAGRKMRAEARDRAPTTDEVLRRIGVERRRSTLSRVLSWPFVVAAMAGAALVFFLDPDQGNRRRAMLRDRAYGLARDAARLAERGSRLAGAEAHGVSQKVTHLRTAEPVVPNDATLVDRVMSEAFRGLDPDLKGRINVNAVGGVVFVRGEVDQPRDISMILERVRTVPGVKDVENLMHLPGTPAPSP